MPAEESALTRREFVPAAVAGAPALARPEKTRPNILWIIAEDLSPDMACYGNRVVATPHLDRLAAEGVRFDRAFVTCPVCSPSRSAIATGVYQTAIGAHHHRSHRDDGYRLPGGIRVFTDYLREAGYHTSNLIEAAPGVRGTGKTDFNFTAPKPFDGTDWSQRRAGQPFYAQVNFIETHRAFHRSPGPPIDPAGVPLPPYYPDHAAARVDFAMYLESLQLLDAKVGAMRKRLEQEGQLEDTIVVFFGDNGRPMPRGKEFLYDEGLRVPLIVRYPERLLPPGVRPGQVCRDLVSTLDITASTLAWAGAPLPAYLDGRPFLAPGAAKRDCVFGARDRCGEAVDRIRCVRTARYKYIRNFFPEKPYTQTNTYKDSSYPTLQLMRQLQAEGKLTGPPAAFLAPSRPAEELYDLEADPHEVLNLAGSAQHRETLRGLRRRLEAWIEETKDRGAAPEESMPLEFTKRTQVDGWSNNSIASKSGGVMRVRCAGRDSRVRRSWVAAPGGMEVRFRARAENVKEAVFSWATIRNMGGDGRKELQKAVTLDGGNGWREYVLPFRTEDYLAGIGFDFPGADGVVEFDWIRLYLGGRQVAGWDFA